MIQKYLAMVAILGAIALTSIGMVTTGINQAKADGFGSFGPGSWHRWDRNALYQCPQLMWKARYWCKYHQCYDMPLYDNPENLRLYTMLVLPARYRLV